jgi:hypothetical protein
MQLVPVDRSNPVVQGVVAAPPEVQEVLERACFDCHSNNTKWPWYSYVAPVSWIVSHHVVEGREEMNLTEWNEILPDKQAHKVDECWELVEEGKMPLPSYVRMHSEAELSDSDKAAIRDWARVAGESSESGDAHEGHNH